MFCWTVSKNIIIFLISRANFLRIIFSFFSCELFKFANICWPEGGGAGAIDFTTKKYVGKIDNFLFIFPFFSWLIENLGNTVGFFVLFYTPPICFVFLFFNIISCLITKIVSVYSSIVYKDCLVVSEYIEHTKQPTNHDFSWRSGPWGALCGRGNFNSRTGHAQAPNRAKWTKGLHLEYCCL